MITMTKELEVGVPKIDAQHKELVDRLNAVTAMGAKTFSKEETQKTLNLLGDYVVKHFGDEEVLQQQAGYPKLAWHKEQHKLFIDEFQKLKKEFEAHGASADFTFALNNSVIKWIVLHIKDADAEFGKYYKSKK